MTTEKQRARMRAYYRRNKDKLALKAKERRERDKDIIAVNKRAYYLKNKEKVSKYMKDYYAKTRAIRLQKKREQTYGVTAAQVVELLASQQHKCAICSTPVKENDSVDHCHNTGKVRGILCALCNTGLGMFRDSKDSLLKAIDYLEGK